MTKKRLKSFGSELQISDRGSHTKSMMKKRHKNSQRFVEEKVEDIYKYPLRKTKLNHSQISIENKNKTNLSQYKNSKNQSKIFRKKIQKNPKNQFFQKSFKENVNLDRGRLNCREELSNDFNQKINQFSSSTQILKKREIEMNLKSFKHRVFDNTFENHTLEYLVVNRRIYECNSQYLERNQHNINWQMRAILLDWVKEVCGDYLFKRETFHYTINFIDRFLSKFKNIQKNELQLVGLAALFLAVKMEEIYIPKIKNILTAAKNTYSTNELLKMETILYQTLEFNISPPTLILWANWFMVQWDKFIINETALR